MLNYKVQYIHVLIELFHPFYKYFSYELIEHNYIDVILTISQYILSEPT